MLAAAEDAHIKELLVHCRRQDFYSEHCREPSPRYCFCCLLWCFFHLPHPAAPFKLLDLAFRIIVAVQPMYSGEEGLAADEQANILKAATGLNRQQIRACAIETSAKGKSSCPSLRTQIAVTSSWGSELCTVAPEFIGLYGANLDSCFLIRSGDADVGCTSVTLLAGRYTLIGLSTCKHHMQTRQSHSDFPSPTKP